jgi:feruloyl esterase
VFRDPAWNWRNFDFDRDWKYATDNFGALLNADDPDLGAFARHGGKLLHYHGWMDTNHAPLRSVEYYEAVLDAAQGGGTREQALARVGNYYRLFMVPGSSGCASTEMHPGEFDPMDVLRAWVERHEAPQRIVATHGMGAAGERSRALCPYPQVAVYAGSGDIFNAANFSCRAPAR